MSILSNLFKKKEKSGGMEDFMYLIRVYYQSSLAARLGISNLQALPDLRLFKQTLKVATVNNKLGIGEKKKCQKMMQDIYGLPDDFFAAIDNSIKSCCQKQTDIRNYLILFQGFMQELMMVVSNTLQLKLRIPSIFKKLLRTVVENGINDIMTKEDWKDAGVRKSVYNIRSYSHRLQYSTQWMVEFTYHVILLAKKEPKPKENANESK